MHKEGIRLKNRKKLWIIAALFVVIVSAIGTGVWYANMREAQRNKQEQAHLFGVDWPDPISQLYELSPEQFIATFGQPQRIEHDRLYNEGIVYSTTLLYDQFCVNYISRGSAENFANVMVTSDEVTMWRGDIGLGSAKTDTETAFSPVKHKHDNAEQDSYHDSLWGVMFEYTEDNIVESIILFPPW